MTGNYHTNVFFTAKECLIRSVKVLLASRYWGGGELYSKFLIKDMSLKKCKQSMDYTHIPSTKKT